jgi:poly(A) polymerase
LRFRYSKNASGALEKRAAVYTKDEHRIDARDVDANAAYICSRLHGMGHETYIVGGAVRDLMLGKKPKDFDIASSASPNEIRRVFRNSRIIGRRFRLVHVFFGDRIYEVATFRSLQDGSSGNTFGTIEDDVKRRDFSVNALFYDCGQELVIDYIGGVEHIKKRVIHPVIPLDVIFQDDPVRMIRAVKYAAMTGFDIPSKLRSKIKAEAALLKDISPSRLTEEIVKIINSACPAEIAASLEEFGLYQYLQPNASRMMKDDKAFREKYLRSLGGISGKAGSQYSSLRGLIEDYVEAVTDWAGEMPEAFKQSYAAARRFVLPMNPQRNELALAMRQIFAAHGIAVKKVRVSDLRGLLREATADSGEAAVQ